MKGEKMNKMDRVDEIMAEFFKSFIGAILIAEAIGFGYFWILILIFNLPFGAAQLIAIMVGFSCWVKLMLSPFPLAMIEWFEERAFRSLDKKTG